MQNQQENINSETLPSEEELKELKASQEKFYDEQLPFLRKLEEYERLKSAIDQHRFNRDVVKLRHAELRADSQPKEKQKAKK